MHKLVLDIQIFPFNPTHRDRALPCSPGWPRIGNHSALTKSKMLGLQACVTMPSKYFLRLEPSPLNQKVDIDYL